MSDRNKIAQALTVEELDAFVSELAGLPGKERTLEQIKHRAALRGITISLMSAKAFRDTTFDRHLERIRRAQETALQVASIESGGNTMADASAKLLSKRIFGQLIEAEDDDAPDEVDVHSLSLAVSRLRRGDQQRSVVEARLRETEAKLKVFEAREKERDEKKAALAAQLKNTAQKQGGITKETLADIESQLALL